MEFMFVLVPICVGLIFLLVFGIFAFTGIVAMRRWMHNNAQPIRSTAATMIAKRTEIADWNSMHRRGRMSTYHYATFELLSGQRMEFWIEGAEYGVLIEGDVGVLSYQGTRFLGFQRDTPTAIRA